MALLRGALPLNIFELMSPIMTAEQTVLKFFSEHALKPLPDNREQIMSCSYLDEGIIDSLGLVTMVTLLEDEQGIQFSPDDMQSYEFQTIGGLVGIVERLAATSK